ncbi:MmyB family transcriptional regulator [Actinomadura kijaniata]|uniref:MmyB family transcriptional regulator n=1 Tax=Actinomadura kijaniata TaxID=46161 RepID=UPI0016001E20
MRAATTTIEHPELGPLTLDCDMLLAPEAGQTLVVCSAPPGTRAATALALLRVTARRGVRSRSWPAPRC